GEARNLAERASVLAEKVRNARDLIQAALFRGEAALGLSDHEVADECLHDALTRARAVNMVEYELPALIALSQLALAQKRFDDARAYLSDVWDSAERGPYPLELADAYNTLAAIARAEGKNAEAIDAA